MKQVTGLLARFIGIGVIVLGSLVLSLSISGQPSSGFSPGTVDAQAVSAATAITSLEPSSCDGSNFSGTITLNGTYIGTIVLIVASHKPSEQFEQTGGQQTLTFTGQTSLPYSVPVTIIAGANSYRVEVLSSNPELDGETTKSASLACGVTNGDNSGGDNGDNGGGDNGGGDNGGTTTVLVVTATPLPATPVPTPMPLPVAPVVIAPPPPPPPSPVVMPVVLPRTGELDGFALLFAAIVALFVAGGIGLRALARRSR